MPWPNNAHTAAENASNAPAFPSFQIICRPDAASPPAKPEAIDIAEGRHRAAIVMLGQANRVLQKCRVRGDDDTAALLAVAQAHAEVSIAYDLLIEALDAAVQGVAA